MRFRAICLIGLFLLLPNLVIAQDSKQTGQVYLDKAAQSFSEGNFEDAVYNYTAYLKINPHTPDILTKRALAYAWMEKFDLADTDLITAFDLAGFSAIQLAIVHSQRAQIRLLQDDADGMLADLSRAIKLDPHQSRYWLNRAIYYQANENWELALADYDEYIKFEANNAEIYLNRARVVLALDDLPTTIKELSSAITLSPENSELYIFRGSVYLQLENFSEAAQDYAEWLYQINTEQLEQEAILNQESRELSMTVGRLYRIPFDALTGERLGVAANSQTVDSLLVLLDPDGNPIMANDDGGRGLNSFFVEFVLPKDGNYTLLVGHARGGSEGDIQLTFQIAPFKGI